VIESQASAQSQAPLLVVCLCAEWCGVCRDYLERFTAVKALIQADYPIARFVWMDVEDEADLLDPLDVENFPTLLIGMGDRPLFWGPITPQAATLERMVRTLAQDVDHPALAQPELAALFTRIRKEKLLTSMPTSPPQG
jgi:thiol-disulfide isomerase/thioredoxin